MKVRRVFWGAEIGRMKLRPSDRVCLLVSVLLCTSAVRCPLDEGCHARQGATFTLCCQMSSQEDVGHNTHTRHPPTAVFDFKSYSLFTSLCTTLMCIYYRVIFYQCVSSLYSKMALNTKTKAAQG